MILKLLCFIFTTKNNVLIEKTFKSFLFKIKKKNVTWLTRLRTKRLELLRNIIHFNLTKDWLPISACSL